MIWVYPEAYLSSGIGGVITLIILILPTLFLPIVILSELKNMHNQALEPTPSGAAHR